MSNRTRNPRSGIIGLLVLAAALAWVVVSNFRGQDAAEGDNTGAPDFALTTLDGKPVRLADFRGKPLVLNFFASWCDPCKEEAPVVKAMAAEAAANGYTVLGVAIQDNRDDAARFMRNEGLDFAAAVDVDGKVHRAYKVIGPPTTFFIDAEGVIRHIFMGPLTPDDVKEGLAKVSGTGETNR